MDLTDRSLAGRDKELDILFRERFGSNSCSEGTRIQSQDRLGDILSMEVPFLDPRSLGPPAFPGVSLHGRRGLACVMSMHWSSRGEPQRSTLLS